MVNFKLGKTNVKMKQTVCHERGTNWLSFCVFMELKNFSLFCIWMVFAGSIYYIYTTWLLLVFFIIIFVKTFFCWIWIHWTQGQWLMCLFICLIWTVSAASHLHLFILFCWHKHIHILWVSIHVVTSLFSSVQK